MLPSDPLIERIYDASVGTRAWTAVMPAVARHCGARSAVLLVTDGRTGELSFADEFGLGTEYRRAYLQDLRRDDLRLDDLVRHPLGTVRTDTMIPHYSAYETSRAYRELYRKLGTEHALGAFVYSDGRRTTGLRLFRSARDGAFGEVEIRRYEALVPHLARAFRLRRLAQEQHRLGLALEQALDLSPWRLLVFEAEGRLLAANAAARALLGRAGEAAERRLGQLVRRSFAAATTSGRRRFLLSTGLGATAGGEARGTEDWQLRIDLLALPPRWDLEEQPVAVVALSRPSEQPAPEAAALAALHGLTPAEAEVVRLLASGRRLGDAPQHLGMSRETAKTHLRHVFAKTGTNRQADLVRLVLAGPLS